MARAKKKAAQQRVRRGGRGALARKGGGGLAPQRLFSEPARRHSKPDRKSFREVLELMPAKNSESPVCVPRSVKPATCMLPACVHLQTWRSRALPAPQRAGRAGHIAGKPAMAVEPNTQGDAQTQRAAEGEAKVRERAIGR